MYFSMKRDNDVKVYFIYSVFHELICSLHVLANPVHHTHRVEWSNKLLCEMTPKMNEMLIKYGKASNEWLDLLDFITETESFDESVFQTLARLENMDDLTFYQHFFLETYEKNTIKQAMMSVVLTPELDDVSKEIFKNPSKEKRKIIDFIYEYYTKFFAKDISFAEPLYIRKLEHQFKTTKEMDIYEFIHSLHPRIEVTHEKINFHKYKLFEVNKKDINRILIFETSFIMPHLLVGFYPNFLTLTFPIYITENNHNDLPSDSLDIFKAIADKTRLQIIKQLYNGPKSTQLLADALNITEAGISKQLKQLHKAKIVSKERDGNYINYHLNIKTIDSITYLLYEIIS